MHVATGSNLAVQSRGDPAENISPGFNIRKLKQAELPWGGPGTPAAPGRPPPAPRGTTDPPQLYPKGGREIRITSLAYPDTLKTRLGYLSFVVIKV